MNPRCTRLLAPLLGPLLATCIGCGPEVDRDVYFVDEPVRELRVASGNADLEVIGGAPDGIRLEVYRWWTRHRPRVGIEVRDALVDVDYGCRSDQSLCAVHLEIVVPSRIDVTVDVDDGDVLLSDIDGEIVVDGNWSEVWGFRLGSRRVDVSTGGGDVTLRHDRAPERLSISTYDGDVEVSVPPGTYDIDVFSYEGEVLVSPFVERDPEASNRISITSELGSIYVRTTQLPRT